MMMRALLTITLVLLAPATAAAGDLRAAFEAAVASRPAVADQVEIADLKPLWLPAGFSKGGLSYEVVIAPGESFIGLRTVPVDVTNGDGEVRRAWAKVAFRRRFEAFEVTRTVRGRAPLEAGDLRPVTLWLDKPMSGLLEAFPGDDGPVVAVSQLDAGTVLLQRHLRLLPLADRGTPVEITVRRGPIFVSTAGKLKVDGRRGERVRVENLSSKKILEGVLVDAGTVEVR